MTIDPATRDGDPFAYAGRGRAEEECFYCLGSGYHFIGSIDGEGEEVVEGVPCRRCEEAS
jgi:hypothetical protein